MAKLTDRTELATPADGDLYVTTDVSDTTDGATGTDKKITWASLKAGFKAYFDTIYSLSSHNHTGTYEPAKGADDNYVTDAEKVVIGNTSGTNTGDNAVNSNYSGLVTNATHTGDVTGATALTVDKTAITGKTAVTAVGADYVLISDTSDSGNLKKALVSDFGTGAVEGTAVLSTGEVGGTKYLREDGDGTCSWQSPPTGSVSDTAYGAGWNGETAVAPSKNAVYDEMELRAPKASPTFTGTVTVPVGLTGVLRADAGVVSVDTDVTDIVSAGSATVAGKLELATDAETVTGTDTARATTPANITAKMSAPGAIGNTTPSTGKFSSVETTGNIEIGHATDTTISRVSAGVVAVEGKNILTTDGGTLTGNITLGENTSIALDPAGSADGKYSGITVTGTGGATIAFGDLVTLDKDDSRWELVDISVAAAATGDARGLLGMAVTSSSDGGALTVLLNGIIRADANFPALTIGAPVYASTTGDVVVTQPTTTDHVIRIVGHALTADELFFCPDNSYTTHT